MKYFLYVMIILTLIGEYAVGQSLNGNVVRLSPTAMPVTCNTGDLRVDSADSYKLKVCKTNTWVTMLDSDGGSVDPTTTAGDMIYNDGSGQERLAIGAVNTVLTSTGSAPSWAKLLDANLDNAAAVAFSKMAALTADRVLISSGAGVVTPSSVTSTTLTYLDIGSSLTTLLSNKQPLDATLTSLAAYNTNGLLAQTSADTFAGRTLTAGSNKISIADGDGVAGNPTIDVTEANLTHDNIGGTLGIAKGGTGQTTANAAFGALSPMTTNGDLITRTGGVPARLAIGAANTVLSSDSSAAAWVNSITNFTLVTPNVDVVTWDGQASTPANPSSGFYKFYFKDDGKAYKLDSTGAESEIGGGSGSGGINYVSNPDAVDDTTGWTTYDDASATLVDGTGGTFDSAFTRTTAIDEVIRNLSIESGSFKLAKDAASREGEGVCTEVAPDRIDFMSSRALHVSFDYLTTSAYESGDVYVAVYAHDDGPQVLAVRNDDDGGVLVAESGSGVSGRFTGTFYTDQINTDYRVCLHIATTNASAWDLIFDNFRVTPEQTVPVPIVTRPAAYTPTFTGFGTVSNVDFKWWRDGSILYVQGKFTSGTATATEARISFPTEAAAGADVGSIRNVGTFGLASTGTTTIKSVLAESLASYFTFGRHQTTVGELTKQNADQIASNGAVFSFHAFVPISGWEASAALSTTETMMMGAVVVAEKSAGSHTSTGNWQDVSWTETYDSLDSFDGTTFTAPRDGRYRIHGTLGFTGHATGIRMVEVANGAGTRLFVGASAIGSTATNQQVPYTGTLDLNAGDTIKVRGFQSSGGNLTYVISNLAIEEIFDPRAFSVYGKTALYPTSGYSSGGLVNYTTTAGQYGDLDSVELPPGEYDFTLQAVWNSNGATTTTDIGIGLGAITGNDGSDMVLGEHRILDIKGTSSASRTSQSLTVPGVVVNAPKTYYFKGFAATSITNLQISWSWRARKVK